MEKAHLSQPMIASLTLFLRRSQTSLHTIIKSLAEYDLGDDDRNFLTTTVNGDNELNAEMKDKMPLLYDHMYGDTDSEFHDWYDSVKSSLYFRSDHCQYSSYFCIIFMDQSSSF